MSKTVSVVIVTLLSLFFVAVLISTTLVHSRFILHSSESSPYSATARLVALQDTSLNMRERILKSAITNSNSSDNNNNDNSSRNSTGKNNPLAASSQSPQNSIPSIPNFGSGLVDDGSKNSTSNNGPISPEISPQKASRDTISNQYIIVLKEDQGTHRSLPTSFQVSSSPNVLSIAQALRNRGAEIVNIYQNVLNGFAIRIPSTIGSDQILNFARKDPRVAFVEQDQKVHLFSETDPTGVNRVDADLNPIAASGRNTNADIAILDTGIDLTHPDLNVYAQKTFVAGTSTANDDEGHGTHVAGIAAAKHNSIGVEGVARGARLWAVKVIDRSGSASVSTVLAGIDYITLHANEIDVVNMSFGCQCSSSALDTAINNSVAKGITYVAAAGNGPTDASRISPANNRNVIAVSAIVDTDGRCGGVGPATAYGRDDAFARFSNFGATVAIAAPGVNILSTYKGGSYATLTGTSMAAPHVAGAVALYKATHPGAHPVDVRSALLNSGSKPSTHCDGNGHGYFFGDLDGFHEPLLYARTL